MKHVTSNDLKRTVEDLNLENYILAYTNYFDSNRLDSIDELPNIIENFHFIYSMFNGITTMLQNAQNYDYQTKNEIF